jgi:hypothetical protein
MSSGDLGAFTLAKFGAKPPKKVAMKPPEKLLNIAKASKVMWIDSFCITLSRVVKVSTASVVKKIASVKIPLKRITM